MQKYKLTYSNEGCLVITNTNNQSGIQISLLTIRQNCLKLISINKHSKPFLFALSYSKEDFNDTLVLEIMDHLKTILVSQRVLVIDYFTECF